MDMGQVACEAWTMIHESNHAGCHLVPWDRLPEIEREAWRASADAVVQFRSLAVRTAPGPCYGPDCDHVSHRERAAIIRAQDEAAEGM